MTYLHLHVFILLSILFFVGLGAALSSSKHIIVPKEYEGNFIEPSTKPNNKVCGDCVNFASKFMTKLISIIVGGMVVVPTCTGVCKELAKETNSTVAGEACLFLCSAVGIGGFVDILNHIDLDYIYFCELVGLCAIFDYGDMEVTSLKVVPPVMKQGTIFHIIATFVSKNGTGTGENIVSLDTVDRFPVYENRLLFPMKPGNYFFNIECNTMPSSGCMTGEPCEQWLLGNYTVHFDLCNGKCGSKSPHSRVYDRKTVDFVVVAN